MNVDLLLDYLKLNIPINYGPYNGRLAGRRVERMLFEIQYNW